MTVGPRTYSSPTSPEAASCPSSRTAKTSTFAIGRPIGIASGCSPAGGGTSYHVQTFVSVGP